MSKKTKRNEKGAIMVEVLAVLALIGVMGPMLFRQVVARNQEISNVNMASEMRTIKEAMSAVIASDGAILGEKCNPTGSNPTLCSAAANATFRDTLMSFLPVGMTEDESNVMNYYDVYLYGYKADFGGVGTSNERPVVYGVLASRSDGLPETWNFRRAARVASLIGSDGGVVDGNNLIGTNGAWELPKGSASIGSEDVVATTAFDTFTPDMGSTTPNAVAIPENVAFKRLHAWQYFSVGSNKGKNETGRCFDMGSREVTDASYVVGDDIYNVATGPGDCDPLFWVGTSAGSPDNSEDGHVYVKNNLYIGRDNANNISAVAIETDAVEDANRKITVYDITGQERITIDALGKIVARAADGETLTMGDGKIESSKTVPTMGGDADGENYQLDPAYTSIMNDIKLASRGGAALSEILPNYISKSVREYTNPASSSNTYTVSIADIKPTCPKGYAAAAIVTPVKWNSSRVTNITTPSRQISGSNISLTSSGTTVSGSITIPEMNMKTTTPKITVEENRKGVAVSIDNNWNLKMGYTDTGAALESGELGVIVQTFCVFDKSAFSNIPSTTRPTPAP